MRVVHVFTVFHSRPSDKRRRGGDFCGRWGHPLVVCWSTICRPASLSSGKAHRWTDQEPSERSAARGRRQLGRAICRCRPDGGGIVRPPRWADGRCSGSASSEDAQNHEVANFSVQIWLSTPSDFRPFTKRLFVRLVKGEVVSAAEGGYAPECTANVSRQCDRIVASERGEAARCCSGGTKNRAVHLLFQWPHSGPCRGQKNLTTIVSCVSIASNVSSAVLERTLLLWTSSWPIKWLALRVPLFRITQWRIGCRSPTVQ